MVDSELAIASSGIRNHYQNYSTLPRNEKQTLSMVQPCLAMPLHRLLSLTLVALSLCCISAQTTDPEVHTPAGTFRGKILTSHSGHEYLSYRGIPYALPPTGDSRFALPVRHPVIEGIYDAKEFGSECFQNKDGKVIGHEDCLFVNVYTPLSVKRENQAYAKKVLVFIHGGGQVIGSSNHYLPGDLVTRGDVIVITLTYRLNWFGFLRGNSSSLPGNLGHWDQLMALHWTRDNIGAFGGDPSDVTLSGESSGSMSTSVFCVSPLTKGLFTKAILLSGGAPFLPAPARTTNDLLQAAADKFGCGAGSVNGREDAVLKCLKLLPGETFVRELLFETLAAGTASGDAILPKPFSQILNDTDYLADVGFFNRDHIVSITSVDGYILVNSRFSHIKPPLLNNGAQFFSALTSLPKNVVKRILEEYKKLYGDEERSLIGFGTDALLLKAELDFIEAYANGLKQGHVKPGKNSYLVSFDHAPKYTPKNYMLHALDLAYLFDVDTKKLMEIFYYIEMKDGFHKEDFELKKVFIDFVVNFMKTGNPNKKFTEEKHVVWPPFDTEKKSYVSFSLQPSVREDILGDRRYIWETLVPQWLQEEQQAESREEL